MSRQPDRQKDKWRQRQPENDLSEVPNIGESKGMFKIKYIRQYLKQMAKKQNY